MFSGLFLGRQFSNRIPHTRKFDDNLLYQMWGRALVF